MPEVEGRRIDFPAGQLGQAPGRLVKSAAVWAPRPGRDRIKPAARLSLQDQNPHQAVDVLREARARIETRGDRPRVDRIAANSCRDSVHGQRALSASSAALIPRIVGERR